MFRKPKPWLWKARIAYYTQIAGVQVRLCSQDRGRAEAQRELYQWLADCGMAPIARSLSVRELLNEFLEDVARPVERGERS
ncbi:hypothetical protein [Tautonia rosea]|uniref:hypothetical protein n=1 Tax=Tautonia rosea TaxID=2728037 RepID=UPI001475C8AC|nr:hypothetical protein [Tautonia rosea]